tara:strand:+ start:144388 stop:145422 length:1035 start_codon:yes stop_codon:yes gene_type:complete
MKLIKFPSIEQFRNVVANVRRMATFVGITEDGDPIYDELAELPTITFKGTVKLHGTNAGVCYNDQDGLYPQSKKQPLTIGKDNFGFASFVKSKEQLFLNTLNHIKEVHSIDTSIYTISLYGEWAGGNIQGIVAIKDLPKSLYTVGCKISKPSDPEFVSFWIDVSEIRFPETDTCWNINEFETFEIDVDFNHPEVAQNKFVELIKYVEDECPVAKQLGVSGIGEGIVWIGEYKGGELRFKTKGEKHAGKSNVKTVKPVDEGRLAIVNGVVDEVTPIWRLNQMFNDATDGGRDINRKHLGGYIKDVIQDVIKEDIDLVIKAGLEMKDVNKGISKIARDYFFEQELV